MEKTVAGAWYSVVIPQKLTIQNVFHIECQYLTKNSEVDFTSDPTQLRDERIICLGY